MSYKCSYTFELVFLFHQVIAFCACDLCLVKMAIIVVIIIIVKEESEKAVIKLNIKKTRVMVSISIISCQMDGGKVEKGTDFIFLGSKISVDGDCSHKMKKCLLLGRKAVTNQDSVFKSRDITLLTKVHIVKAMVFQ